MEFTSQQHNESTGEKTFIKANKSDIIKPSFLLNRFVGALRILAFYLLAVFFWEVLKINLSISIIISFLLGPFLVELLFYNNKHRKYRILINCPFCNANLSLFPKKAMLKREFIQETICPDCHKELVVSYKNEYY